MKRALFYVISIIFMYSSSLYSAEKIRMAVLDLEAKNIPKSAASAVTDMVIGELVNTGVFEILERNQMNDILKEQGFQQSGCTDQSCAVKIGKLISARKILLGSVSKAGDTFVLNIRMVDVEKGVAELAAMEQAENESSTPAAAKRIARKIAKKTGSEIKEEEEETAAFSKRGYYLRGIVPGWGQIYAGSETKGYIFLTGFVLAGAAAIYGVMDFNKKEEEYMDLPAGTAQSEFNSKNDAKKSAGLLALSLISITGLIYAANWIDLLFVTDMPDAKTAKVKTDAGEICFNAGANIMAPHVRERQYSMSIGMRF